MSHTYSTSTHHRLVVDLQRQLARRRQHDANRAVVVAELGLVEDVADHRQHERERLAGALQRTAAKNTYMT